MAMLAEPKKKSKYRLQPFSGFSKINKRCDDDTSSYGYKLMSSMGWAPGKGLGRNESGNVDPIKLRLKNDEAGLGYKVSEDDALAQQSEFQALLLQLNSSATDGEDQSEGMKKKSKKEKLRSLEKQSEQSSVRVHYKKFTRGKDLSRASEKDLRSILGISSESPKVKEPVLKVPEPVSDTPEVHKGNMYITSGSSVDYFKKKYQEKRGQTDVQLQEDAMVEDGYQQQRRVSWGDVEVSYVDKYIKDVVDTSGSVDESLSNSMQEEPVKKKKKKKKYEQFQTEASERNIEDIALTNNDEKKANKRKRSEEDATKENAVQEHDHHNVLKKKEKWKASSTDQDGKHSIQTNSDMHYQDTEALCPEEPIISSVDSDELPKKKKRKRKNQVSALPDETL